MTKEDYKLFCGIWIGVGKVCKHQVEDVELVIAFDILRNHHIVDIKNAIRNYLRDPKRGRFFPTPADVIEFINSDKKNSFQSVKYISKRPNAEIRNNAINKIGDLLKNMKLTQNKRANI